MSHTIPGTPIALLIGVKVSVNDDITETSVEKYDFCAPTTSALSNYWCNITGNTIRFTFAGYSGNNYGAVKFDVIYI